jgi:hypothetical protein
MADFDETIHAVGVAIQARVPVLLQGAPGVAKTAIVQALLAQLCDEVHTSIVALHEPAEYGGFPVPIEETVTTGTNGSAETHAARRVMLVPNDWAIRLAAAERPGLFLDELTGGAPATRAAAMRGIHEGVWGAQKIENLATVAAQNPPEYAEGGYDLSAPLANRFCHVDWQMPAAWWVSKLLAGFPPPQAQRLPERWRERHWPQARALLAAYASHQPTLMQQMPEEASRRSGPWPSYRSWTMATELVAASSSVGWGLEHGVTLQLVAGCVGTGPAMQFLTYSRELDLPDPEELLRNPGGLVLPARGDRAYAVLTAVVSAVLADNTPKRWTAGFEVLAAAHKQNRKDVAASACKTLAENRPAGAAVPAVVDEFIPTLKDAAMLR